MQKIITPPYVESPDNIRCGQSVILMILKHFLPEKEWTFEDADKFCGYVEGKWTWSEAAAVSLAELGFDIKCYTDMDAEEFIRSPDTYFIDKYGPELGRATNKNIDMASSIHICKRYIASNSIHTIKRGWNIQEAAALLEQGYLLMIWVNPRILHSQHSGDGGHFVLVFHYSEEKQAVLFHDPGYHASSLGGIQTNAWKSAYVGIEHLMNAARADGENGSALTAFRWNKG